MDCCSQVVKYGMFISNLIIFVSSNEPFAETGSHTKFLSFRLQIGGLSVFVLGLITLIDRNFLSELLGTNLFSGAVYVLVITSALVCLLSFFGCFGAVREVKFMLLTVS